jgi:hypothetical protein
MRGQGRQAGLLEARVSQEHRPLLGSSSSEISDSILAQMMTWRALGGGVGLHELA